LESNANLWAPLVDALDPFLLPHGPLLPVRLLISHFVVSMPSEMGLWVHGWSFKKATSLTYEICKRHRVFAGAVIFHPWRQDDDSPEFVPDGYWHFHVIGLHFVPTTPGGTDRGPDGRIIVFKHIRDDEYGNYGGLRSGLAIKRVIQYQLSHAGLLEGRQALTYFGLLAPSRLPQVEVHSTFSWSLEADSKTNPRTPSVCPGCGYRKLEPCTKMDHFDSETMYLHPEPVVEPTLELVQQAAVGLEERFQTSYDTEPDPTKRHDLTQERQHERMKLAQRELELYNMNDPLVQAWTWLKSGLQAGSKPRDWFISQGRGQSFEPEVLERCIELNLKHGRLSITPGERLRLSMEYELADALRDVRTLVLSGEPNDGRDWRLERLLRANQAENNPILTDAGFVFGDTLDRLIETNIGGT